MGVFCSFFGAVLSRSGASGPGFSVGHGQSRAEEVEKDSDRVVRRHGFSRDDERKSTTIKVPSRNQKSGREENKRPQPANKKDDANYGYPARSAETATDVPAEAKSKFGPPPRK